MKSGIATISGVGIGALLMYFLDPARGRRRRAMIQDQVVKAGHKVSAAADTTARDVRNRSTGLLWTSDIRVDANQLVADRPRLLTTVAGSSLAILGLRRRGLGGTGMAAVGAGFLTRGLTNRELSRLFQREKTHA